MIGSPSPEILGAILETIPIEITILDEDDRIIAWNTRRPRIFDRPIDVLGRDVRACHSHKSLGTLEAMLREMKEGQRDCARFWYDQTVEGRSRKIVIDYFAIRDEVGRYLGCVEALQDAEPFRALEGEKRLLDD